MSQASKQRIEKNASVAGHAKNPNDRTPKKINALPDDCVEIGKVSGPFGVHGQLKIYLHSDGEVLLETDTWYMQLGTQNFVLDVKDSRRHQKNYIVATVDGFASPEFVETFRHASIMVEREDLPEPEDDEFYWVDLVGKAVYNSYPDAVNPIYLGTVDHLLETPAQHLLSIKTQEGQAKHHQLLIPFLDQYVQDVDLENNKIIVNWSF